MDNTFCIEALEDAFAMSGHQPEIFNTDQGVQFTSHNFIAVLTSRDVQVSMDGKGRAIDNVFIERFWRSLKYEDIYLNAYETTADLHQGLARHVELYSTERLHQWLGGQTPKSDHEQAA